MALSQIPNPYGVIEWQDWIDTLVGFNLSVRPNVDPDQPWQVVAERLAEYDANVPRPIMFRDWREWAASLKQAYPD